MDHNLISKNKLIMVALYSFAENFRKEVTTELIKIWLDGLKTLSCEQIEEGTRRCLRECEFFPPMATFIEKATQGRKLALLKEKSLRLKKKAKLFQCPMNLKICSKSIYNRKKLN